MIQMMIGYVYRLIYIYIYIGDYCPDTLYINKITHKIKNTKQNYSFICILIGFIIQRNLIKYKFNKHHTMLLKKILLYFLEKRICNAVLDAPIPCFQQRV